MPRRMPDGQVMAQSEGDIQRALERTAKEEALRKQAEEREAERKRNEK